MTQQVIKAQVRFFTSATHTDSSSFDLYFEATGSDSNITMTNPGHDDPPGVIDKFLNHTYSVSPLSESLSGDISRVTGYQVDYTDITAHLDGSPAGAPFRSDTGLTLAANTVGIALPPACAAVVGYRRSYGSDIEKGSPTSLPSSEAAIDQGAPATHIGSPRPRARDRGRFYFGPLASDALATNDGLLAPSFVARLQPAVVDLFTEHNPGRFDQFSVVQWSRRNASVAPVGFYFIGEAMGYIRRRADENALRVHTWVSV